MICPSSSQICDLAILSVPARSRSSNISNILKFQVFFRCWIHAVIWKSLGNTNVSGISTSLAQAKLTITLFPLRPQKTFKTSGLMGEGGENIQGNEPVKTCEYVLVSIILDFPKWLQLSRLHFSADRWSSSPQQLTGQRAMGSEMTDDWTVKLISKPSGAEQKVPAAGESYAPSSDALSQWPSQVLITQPRRFQRSRVHRSEG